MTSEATADRPGGVRDGRADDLPELAAIWLRMMRAHVHRDRSFALADDCVLRWQEMAQELMARDDGFALVACGDRGQPVGFALGWLADNPPIYRQTRVGFVSELAVDGPWQRRGLGERLLDGCRRWFRQVGVEDFQLATAVWNDAAQALWRHAGGEPMLIRYRFTTGLTP